MYYKKYMENIALNRFCNKHSVAMAFPSLGEVKNELQGNCQKQTKAWYLKWTGNLRQHNIEKYTLEAEHKNTL